jgi:putative hydrolase of the HAD superfamily
VRAVVVDLFGTLTVEQRREALTGRTSEALGVAPEMFWRHLVRTFSARITGQHGDTRQTLAYLAAACRATPKPAVLDRALAVHHEASACLRAPRAGALAVLTELRERGFPVGLISDRGSEVHETWSGSGYATLIDAAVLSWTGSRARGSTSPRRGAWASRRGSAGTWAMAAAANMPTPTRPG